MNFIFINILQQTEILFGKCWCDWLIIRLFHMQVYYVLRTICNVFVKVTIYSLVLIQRNNICYKINIVHVALDFFI